MPDQLARTIPGSTRSSTGTSVLGPTSRRRCSSTLGYESLGELVDAAVPAVIREAKPLALPDPLTETDALARLRELAGRNEVFTSLIGLGYHDTVTPPVILRNVLENPAWYTAYTPYQPEISQGRLEALLNFQTMVSDLTGMDLANASLLDEGTAAAEAMAMLHRLNPKKGMVFFVDADAHPQTIDVVRTRAEPLGIEVVVGDPDDAGALDVDGCFGVFVQYPGSSGRLRDLAPADRARARARRAGVRRGRSARAHARDAAGRDGCRRGGRHDAAVRRAARLRRPARRVPRGARRTPAHAGRAARRRVDRRAGSHRVPPRVADARAAHPAREGDEQHLHRPGAARGHRRVCTPRTTVPTVCARSRAACTDSPTGSRPRCARVGSRSCTSTTSTR